MVPRPLNVLTDVHHEGFKVQNQTLDSLNAILSHLEDINYEARDPEMIIEKVAAAKAGLKSLISGIKKRPSPKIDSNIIKSMPNAEKVVNHVIRLFGESFSSTKSKPEAITVTNLQDAVETSNPFLVSSPIKTAAINNVALHRRTGTSSTVSLNHLDN